MSHPDIHHPGANSFWEEKTLWEMTQEEWEMLCDHCGLCCLIKLRDEDTDEVFYTSVACKLLDLNHCQCSDYTNRYKKVPGCLNLSAKRVYQYEWLPHSCAYVKISIGVKLEKWHYLISGSYETVHQEGISLRGKMIPEGNVDFEQIFDFVVNLPG